MKKPVFIAISDIHFSVPNLELASKSLQAALSKAEELNIPLIIAGDLNDTKAIIRAEVANALIRILKPAKVRVYILEGNHDKVNEKGKEHGLNYLRPYATIIDEPDIFTFNFTEIHLIPYMSDSSRLILPTPNAFTKILVMHQGFRGAFMGDYIQDKSSISTDVVKDYTVISGHYHRHQTLGTVTYIGSPYTITYGEANDGPKGFLIVNEDGTFTREILNLRKHITLERTVDTLNEPIPNYNPGDLVKIKVRGTREQLLKVRKQDTNHRLELIQEQGATKEVERLDLNDHELMLKLISSVPDSEELTKLYMEIVNETN